MAKKRKVRVDFTRNRAKKRRKGDFTRDWRQDAESLDDVAGGERVRAKGDLSRKRTVKVDEDDNLATAGAIRGRALMVHGLYCTVVVGAKVYKCYTRRLLKSMASDERSVVTAGDWVWFKPAPDDEGMIVRVEDRHGVITRRYRGQEHVIAANIDQVLIVAALVQPELKPNLLDRYLVSAFQGGVAPLICFNKIDLVQAWLVQPYVGIYSQLGYPVLLTSAESGAGAERLRDFLAGKHTVIVGQSGVGKSSLLNRLEPELHLRVGGISEASNKGKHTTTTAQLLTLPGGGTVIDTPGIRQFELSDLPKSDLEHAFREFRPYARQCRFPGCTHGDEAGCAVGRAVDDHLISRSRYDSYLRLLGDEASLTDPGIDFDLSEQP